MTIKFINELPFTSSYVFIKECKINVNKVGKIKEWNQKIKEKTIRVLADTRNQVYNQEWVSTEEMKTADFYNGYCFSPVISKYW